MKGRLIVRRLQQLCGRRRRVHYCARSGHNTPKVRVDRARAITSNICQFSCGVQVNTKAQHIPRASDSQVKRALDYWSIVFNAIVRDDLSGPIAPQ